MVGVYKVKDDGKKNYYLELKENMFITPEKLYGDMEILALRFWKAFAISKGSMGIMLTGASGSGKTALSMVLSNIAITNNMFVVEVSEITATIELVRFLDSLNNAVILYDEFGKNFNINLQDKMLTMLSNVNYSKKLFIITENETRDISRYIRNRPGRVRYHIDFTRISKTVIDEVCKDYSVDRDFYDELIRVYNKSTVFSFDHLMALVTEHNNNPKDSFEYILGILNLDILTKQEMVSVLEVIDMKTNEPVEIESSDGISRKDFESGRYLWAYRKMAPAIKIKSSNVVNIDSSSGMYTAEVDNKYKITMLVE